MSAFMVTFTHDFATKWEMEAHIRRGFEQTMPLQDKMAELGLTGVEHGILCGQKDKHRHMTIMRFKSAEAYKMCMELINGVDWDREISRVDRVETYVIGFTFTPD